jgi:hypothetical protein
MSADSTEVRIKNETTGGEKGQKLDRFDLIPAEPLRQIAHHYGVGAKKYADRNWELGYNWDLSYGALMRHLNAWWGGEDIDEETGSSHLAAAAFHVLALLEFTRTHPELDTRPSTVAANKALEETLSSWRSVIHIPSVTISPLEVASDALNLFFGATAAEASKGTHSLTVESIGPDYTPVESVQPYREDADEVALRQEGQSPPRGEVGYSLETTEAFRELPIGTVIEWAKGQNADSPVRRIKVEEDGWRRADIVTSSRHWITPSSSLSRGHTIVSLPEPPAPKYQAGERASVRDIIKALQGDGSDSVIVEDEEDVAILAPFGSTEFVVKNVEAILDALEDAGFQVTKA